MRAVVRLLAAGCGGCCSVPSRFGLRARSVALVARVAARSRWVAHALLVWLRLGRCALLVRSRKPRPPLPRLDNRSRGRGAMRGASHCEPPLARCPRVASGCLRVLSRPATGGVRTAIAATRKPQVNRLSLPYFHVAQPSRLSLRMHPPAPARVCVGGAYLLINY